MTSFNRDVDYVHTIILEFYLRIFLWKWFGAFSNDESKIRHYSEPPLGGVESILFTLL